MSSITTAVASVSESTRRAARTALQVLGAFAALAVLVAIPEVQSAIVTVVQLVAPGVALPPALFAAVGVLGAAVTALVSKLQNLAEGRDRPTTLTAWAAEAEELRALLADVQAAVEGIKESAQPVTLTYPAPTVASPTVDVAGTVTAP